MEYVMYNFPACRATLLAAPVFGLIAFPAWADAPTVIKVDLDNTGSMQMLKLEPSTVTAGKVRFQVSNASVDSEHEMIVVKTPLTPDKLPTNADHSKVNERKIKDPRPKGRGIVEVSQSPARGEQDVGLADASDERRKRRGMRPAGIQEPSPCPLPRAPLRRRTASELLDRSGLVRRRG